MRVQTLVFLVVTGCFAASTAAALPAAAPGVALAGCSIETAPRDPWAVEFGASAAPLRSPLRYAAAGAQTVPARRPIPVEYSEGYKTRATIHKYASFATLPVFVANYIVGQDLYNNRGDESKKSLHVGLVTGSAVLFGVNTVTGVWNLWEGRNDPNQRTRKMTHGILMIVADVGFLATAMLAPEGEGHEHGAAAPTIGSSSANTHRAVALTSMGIATVSYFIMLLGGH